MNSKRLFLDFETFSPEDISLVGLKAYVGHKDFRVLCAASGGKQISNKNLMGLLKEPKTIIAHNASFERAVLERLGVDVSKHRFLCTAHMSSTLGGPLSLKECAFFFNIESKKDDAGKVYISYFYKNLKEMSLKDLLNTEEGKDKFDKLVEYCVSDTEVLEALFNKLNSIIDVDSEEFKKEHRFYMDTQEMNDLGIPIDLDYVNKLVKINEEFKPISEKAFRDKYGINPRSSKQVLNWLNNKAISSTQRPIVQKYWAKLTEEQKEMFEDKWLLSSVQVKRLERVEDALVDGRLKGFLIHFGARTGRYTSKGINVLNFPKGHSLASIDETTFIDTYKDKSGKKVLETIRGVISPKEGNLICSDLKQIELRLLLWYLGYYDILDDLNAGKDIYLDFAESIYGVRPDKDSVERTIAKTTMLSLGYGASFSVAVTNIARLVKNPDLKAIKKAYIGYHKKFPKVKELAKKFDLLKKKRNYFKLPNGSRRYFDPFNRKVYGSLLVARFFQSMARDILFEKQSKLRSMGFKVVFNVYDEVVVETNNEDDMLKVHEVMNENMDWLPKLVLQAETSLVKRYGGDPIKVLEAI